MGVGLDAYLFHSFNLYEMNNIEKLYQVGGLGEIRKRLGAETGFDTVCDLEINEMTNDELVAAYCAWRLGSGAWWEQFKNMFDKLEKLDRENTCPISTK